MSITRLAGALLGGVMMMVMLASCSPEDPFYPTAPPVEITGAAYLRIVHAAADAPAVTPVLGGKVFRGEVSFLSYRAGVNEAKYYPADTTSKVLAFLAGTGALASAPVKLEAGRFYTAYLYGNSPDYGVLVTSDTIQPNPTVTEVKLRVVNLSPDSPPVDVWFTGNPTPVARNVSYGTASAYNLRSLTGLGRPGVTIVRSQTQDTILAFPVNQIFLPGSAVLSLVLTGFSQPAGEQSMLTMAAFIDNGYDPESELFGGLPLKLEFAGIRAVNLMPTGDTKSLDVSFYDRDYFIKYGGLNDGYRRNYPGQDSILYIPSHGFLDRRVEGYFLQSASKTEYVYRIEYATAPNNIDPQPMAAGPDTLRVEPNKRYTIVAFGPDSTKASGAIDYARTVWLRDNVPAPSSNGVVRVRFFHGGFGEHESQALTIRINGLSTPAMRYGQEPTAADAIEVSAGATTVELLDPSGTVLLSTTFNLIGGKTYTIFYFRGRYGDVHIMRAVADDLHGD